MTTLTQKLDHKRRSDHRERLIGFVIGSVFNASLAAGIAEKLGFLHTRIFTQIVFWYVVVFVVCIALVILFILSSVVKNTRLIWSDKTELQTVGRGIAKSFVQMDPAAYIALLVAAGAIYFIGHHVLALLLLGMVATVLLISGSLAIVALWRASKL